MRPSKRSRTLAVDAVIVPLARVDAPVRVGVGALPVPLPVHPVPFEPLPVRVHGLRGVCARACVYGLGLDWTGLLELELDWMMPHAACTCTHVRTCPRPCSVPSRIVPLYEVIIVAGGRR